MQVVRYTEQWSELWDEFVLHSRNATFHVTRRFLSYHNDRFQDHSLLILDDDKKIIAAIPLNADADKVSSHSGLTFGGFIFSKNTYLEENLKAMRAAILYLKEQGFKSLYYKTIPHIYHEILTDDDLYFLFVNKANVVCRHVNPVILPSKNLEYQNRRIRMIKKAEQAGISARKCDNLKEYWEIVEQLLSAYNTKPVHSFEEMNFIQKLFPDQVKLFGAFQGDTLLAGILVYESNTVAKFQYIAANEMGKNIGALDLLIDTLIKSEYPNKIIDFGTVTGDSGHFLSIGLSNQKEGFGARTTVHDHYLLSLENIDVQEASK